MSISDKLLNKFKVKVTKRGLDNRLSLCGDKFVNGIVYIPAHQSEYIKKMYPQYNVDEDNPVVGIPAVASFLTPINDSIGNPANAVNDKRVQEQVEKEPEITPDYLDKLLNGRQAQRDAATPIGEAGQFKCLHPACDFVGKTGHGLRLHGKKHKKEAVPV